MRVGVSGKISVFLLQAGRSKSNQIFHYTRNITRKRVTSLRDPSRFIASVGNTAPFEEMSQQWQAVGNTVFDMTGPRFEPRTSRSETNALPLDELACNW